MPRHVFFDNAFLEHAYEDKAFPIGEGQTISQPFTVAYQTQMLQVFPGAKVLEIGTGSGYQCCILLEMGADVYTIEYNKVLYDRAKKMLKLMGYKPFFFHGDGSLGLPRHAPFDRILVTAGAPAVPAALIEQLNRPGVMVIPVGDKNSQRMLRISKSTAGEVREEELDLFSFVPLVGDQGWNGKNRT